MRKIKQISPEVAVYFDKEWDEYVARIKDRPNSDYRTDDKEDALDTAAHMAEHADLTPQDLSVGEEYDVDETVVYADKAEEVYIVWNRSATFNLWVGEHNVDCFTVYDVKTVGQAIDIANEWFAERLEELA